MASALVGCAPGALLAKETGTMLGTAGFRAIVMTSNPGYVRNMQNRKESVYRQIVEKLPKGDEIADYDVSLSITARK